MIGCVVCGDTHDGPKEWKGSRVKTCSDACRKQRRNQKDRERAANKEVFKPIICTLSEDERLLERLFFKNKADSLNPHQRDQRSEYYDARLRAAGIHFVCDWNRDSIPSTSSSYRPTAVFTCHKHGTRNRVAIRTLLKRKKLTDQAPGCRECQREYFNKKVRPLASGQDNLEAFLSGDADPLMPATFYLTPVSNGGTKKIGIAQDFAKRAYTAKHQGAEYGVPLFLSTPLPRAWVWTAEQFILSCTEHLKVVKTKVPDSWGGRSELRSNLLDVSQVIQLFWNVIDMIISSDGDWFGTYKLCMNW